MNNNNKNDITSIDVVLTAVLPFITKALKDLNDGNTSDASDELLEAYQFIKENIA